MMYNEFINIGNKVKKKQNNITLTLHLKTKMSCQKLPIEYEFHYAKRNTNNKNAKEGHLAPYKK